MDYEHEKQMKWNPVKIVIVIGALSEMIKQELFDKEGFYRANTLISKSVTLDLVKCTVNEFSQIESLSNKIREDK